MAEKKLTKVQKLNAIATQFAGQSLTVDNITFDIAEFCEYEIALLQKKAENKKTKVSDESLALMEKLVAVLEDAPKALTVAEIRATDAYFGGLAPQKITPKLTDLCKTGRIKKDSVKGRTVYSVA